MKVLILGGTVFLGRHLIDCALSRGHEVTLFNRGTHAGLYPNLEQLHGDRDGSLDSLRGRRWDVAIDTSGYLPRVVAASAEQLANSVEHYTFISSVSVYPMMQADKSEAAPVDSLNEEGSEDAQKHYGPLKALCEQGVEEAMPGRSLNLRPGLIVGPLDPTERFTYWPLRIARGGEVLVPGPRERQIQFIDVRDLADWTIRLAERRQAGVFNATGPARKLTMGEFMDDCLRVSKRDARLTWIEDEAWLLQHGAEPWMGFPLWLPPSLGGLLAPIERALDAGLEIRPVHETISDTLNWAIERPELPPLPRTGRRAGTSPEKEAALLAAWRAEHVSV